MARLRRSDLSGGHCIRRRRAGPGFSYRWDTGDPVDGDTRRRIQALAIPPAWTDVWICPWPNGHIQAVGTDAKGRRQYRYHDAWREHRDREKFRRILTFAQALPGVRRQVAADLDQEGLPRTRVLACAVRLLDEGCFRIGSEQYAEENETFGLATLRREHVTVSGSTLHFDYPAKGSIDRELEVDDPAAAAVVALLKKRRGGGGHLFAYRDGRRWVEMASSEVNAYIKDIAGDDYSAKDFRTWSGTVHAAAVLARSDPAAAPSAAARKRLVVAAVKETAAYLGNTPAVCRKSYIDPGVVDRFDAGETIAAALRRVKDPTAPLRSADRQRVEAAVLSLLGAERAGRRRAPTLAA